MQASGKEGRVVLRSSSAHLLESWEMRRDVEPPALAARISLHEQDGLELDEAQQKLWREKACDCPAGRVMAVSRCVWPCDVFGVGGMGQWRLRA